MLAAGSAHALATAPAHARIAAIRRVAFIGKSPLSSKWNSLAPARFDCYPLERPVEGDAAYVYLVVGHCLVGGSKVQLVAGLQCLVSPVRWRQPLEPVEALQAGRLADDVGRAWFDHDLVIADH